MPPAECQILAPNRTGDNPGGWGPLEQIKQIRVESGQVVNTTIDAPEKTVVQATRVQGQQSDSTPSRTLKGFILQPDGKPAVEAGVGFAGDQHDLHIGDGQLVVERMNPNTAFTDSSGAFAVPWPNSATALYVASGQGVANLNIAGVTNGMRIVLQPWAKVEGIMRLNNRPAPGAQIHLHNIGGDRFGWWEGRVFMTDTITDANGHFLFAHVLPGKCGLGRWMDAGHGTRSIGDDVLLTVAPGESTNIAWGGNGRPVTGVVELANPKNLPDDAAFVIFFRSRFQSFPKEPRMARRAFHDYEGLIGSDNTFRADDVPPGYYAVAVTGRTGHLGSARPFPQSVTVEVTNIDVPPLADPKKCEPFDIGRIKVSLEFPSETTASQTPGAE